MRLLLIFLIFSTKLFGDEPVTTFAHTLESTQDATWADAPHSTRLKAKILVPEGGGAGEVPSLPLYYNWYRNLRHEGGATEVVLLLQGRNEYASQYKEMAQALLERGGRDVFTYDLRGQGASGGERCFVNDYDEYLSDLLFLVQALREHYQRVHLVGHSTGGLIAALFSSQFGDALGEGATLTMLSPFISLNKNFLLKPLIRVISAFRKKSRCLMESADKSPPSFLANHLTTDPTLYETYVGPQNTNRGRKCGPPTWGWMNASFRAQQRLLKSPSIRIPTHLITAGKDKVVKSPKAHAFCQSLKAQGTLCQMESFEDSKHNLHHDLKKEEVFTSIHDFLQSHGGQKA